jgi:hypothetical protein
LSDAACELASSPSATVVDATPGDLSRSSSGGAITSRRTGTGTYQVIFAGLARAAGEKEIVMVARFAAGGPVNICTIPSWGRRGPAISR